MPALTKVSYVYAFTAAAFSVARVVAAAAEAGGAGGGGDTAVPTIVGVVIACCCGASKEHEPTKRDAAAAAAPVAAAAAMGGECSPLLACGAGVVGFCAQSGVPRDDAALKRIAGMPPGVVIRLLRDAARSCGVVMLARCAERGRDAGAWRGRGRGRGGC